MGCGVGVSTGYKIPHSILNSGLFIAAIYFHI